ncbi:MAG: DUF523 domain-containing protein [Actinobacteria bacterium]|nr:DUF523 domain-containing protein [Actinomycetota bacterium]
MALRIIVSACLLGVRCAYDGKHRRNESIIEMISKRKCSLFGVCPEYFIFGVPREPLEIFNGDGFDFLKGRSVLKRADGKEFKIDDIKNELKILENWIKFIKPDEAYLREKSPFCGVYSIYNGTFSGQLRNGSGLFAAMLKKREIRVFGVLDGSNRN